LSSDEKSKAISSDGNVVVVNGYHDGDDDSETNKTKKKSKEKTKSKKSSSKTKYTKEVRNSKQNGNVQKSDCAVGAVSLLSNDSGLLAF